MFFSDYITMTNFPFDLVTEVFKKPFDWQVEIRFFEFIIHSYFSILFKLIGCWKVNHLNKNNGQKFLRLTQKAVLSFADSGSFSWFSEGES
ncbi:MAG: hypothetical protein ACI8W9_001728 [Psychromonas sp.]